MRLEIEMPNKLFSHLCFHIGLPKRALKHALNVYFSVYKLIANYFYYIITLISNREFFLKIGDMETASYISDSYLNTPSEKKEYIEIISRHLINNNKIKE